MRLSLATLTTASLCAIGAAGSLLPGAQGAEWLHFVDLDAAFNRGSNYELMAEITSSLDIADVDAAPARLMGLLRLRWIQVMTCW